MNEPNDPRAWPALIVTTVLALVCAVAAGVAASAAVAELTREPTADELRRAATAEVSRRWQVWPAGRLFPETIQYAAEQGGQESARRVGIAADHRCHTAVDAKLVPALRAAGCQALLRATYIDALQGVVVTIGVAAFPDETRAMRAEEALPSGERPEPGLRALAFPGTVTDRFTAEGRQAGSVRQGGPYVVLTTAGQVDGRPARAVGEQRPAVFAFARSLAERVLTGLTRPVTPDCASPEWLC
ncbi:hypothetical protein [Spongiactinospora sp. TRM90649]|uniref:hypothetical protein n=1 Tax=Spongiactinospora sp. TRM90649 TaxID=3031114 RepID=UPI0023F81ABB|nr:hypothetical protein [Spongiactinospora sp. TRM90649]MDF5755509.1 hypothetical protein [Spongiactinospora sp. TRM90649]